MRQGLPNPPPKHTKKESRPSPAASRTSFRLGRPTSGWRRKSRRRRPSCAMRRIAAWTSSRRPATWRMTHKGQWRRVGFRTHEFDGFPDVWLTLVGGRPVQSEPADRWPRGYLSCCLTLFCFDCFFWGGWRNRLLYVGLMGPGVWWTYFFEIILLRAVGPT